MATIRRWWIFMGLSVLLNLAALTLMGHFWRPIPASVSHAPQLMVTLTLLPPTPKVKRPVPKPPLPAKITPPRPHPRAMATPLPPSPHQTPQAAPAADLAGGTAAPRPKPQPKPADRFHLLDPVSAQADIVQAPKTTATDQPDDMASGSGTTPAVSDPGPATTQAPGKAAEDTGGTQDSGSQGHGTSGTGNGTGAGAGAGAGTGLFGTHGSGGGGSAPRHIVYVLDISGSMDMAEKKFGGKKRIEQARQELTAQFQTLGEGETFSLIAFSDDIRLFRPVLVKADADTIREAEQFLDGLQPDGDTDLERALKAALAVPDVNVVVLITDGVPHTRDFEYTTHDDFYKLATRIAAADPAHVPIYAYGLLGPNPDGTNDSQEASGFLAQIAADSGGKFVEVKLAGEGR